MKPKIFMMKDKLKLLKKTLDDVFKDTSVEYFIVGSQMIDNVESHDVDVLLTFDFSMNIAELRMVRKVIWSLMSADRSGTDSDGYRYNLIPNFKKDNVKLKTDFLFYDFKTKEEKKADKEKLSEQEYDDLKLHLRTTLPFRKQYYKSIIPSKESTAFLSQISKVIVSD